MTPILVSLLAVETAGLGLFIWLYIRSIQSLARYQSIRDVEAHKRDCEQEAQQALAKRDQLNGESESLGDQIGQQKTKVAQYQKYLGDLGTAAELQDRIKKDKARAQRIAATLGQLERAEQLNEYLRKQEADIAAKKAELDGFAAAIGQARSASEIAAQVQYYENFLAELKAQVYDVEEAGELQEFGYYRSRYDFESAEEYKERLDWIKDGQKGMLKLKTACVCTTEWTVEGSKREGQKMVDQQIKLMLRAFNGECDAAIVKARYNNATALEKRISKSFEQINKLGETKRIYLAPEFLNLKLEELRLSYEYEVQKQNEKEEQQRIRAEMREEERVTKEIEKARKDAERDEDEKEKALQRARDELAKQTGAQTAKLAALVARLENELQDALDRKAKAIARAQLTKSGHVYVLSNIGSFGDDVYKLGLTRRLEPLDRVKELSDASVPFEFDVHAMIYSEDAPALERALHEYFADRRVNMVNLRREFFHVTLDEIRAAVAQLFGQVTFVKVPKAEQYRETLALRKEQERERSPLHIA